MTFNDDFARIHWPAPRGTKDVFLKLNHLHWPPPPRIYLESTHFKRISMSQITDEQRRTMTHVARGAVYYPE